MYNGWMESRPFLLELQNVTVIKGDENKRVLDGVSLTIRQSENVAILGPNGSGKSSLVKTITREYYPSAGGGSMRILGRERWDVFKLRPLLGIVSNEMQFACTRDYSGMETVLSGFFSSIGLVRPATAAMKRKAVAVLKFLEIEHLKDRPVSVMSSGEGRRFLIARALVHYPQTLILDEPTNSLDLKASHHFRGTIRKIVRSGKGLVLVTQTLEDIVPEITRVVLMKNSRVFADGPKEKILTSEKIGKLFDLKVRLRRENGFYHAVC